MGDYLIHYRTPGSKNGIRLYQYKDGTLTPAGRRRYLDGKIKGNTVSKEYEEELDFNSQQNVYPSGFDNPNSKPKPKSNSRQRVSKSDEINKKISKVDREYPHGYASWYDKNNEVWRKKRTRDPESRKPVRIDTAIALLADGAIEVGRRVVVEPIKKILDIAGKEVKSHIKKYFENSFGKHFGYQISPPKGSDGVNELVQYTNKEASDALDSYINSVSTGSIGSYINTFIQTTQMNIANGCSRFLDSIGMDGKVNKFLKKLGIKDNLDIIEDMSINLDRIKY